MHWPTPIVSVAPPDDRGPVAIQIAYEIDPADKDRFLDLLSRLAEARRRNGAYGWSVMEDAASPSRFVECWQEASWLQHLRHHERVSGSDHTIQDEIAKLHRGTSPPTAVHLISVG